MAKLSSKPAKGTQDLLPQDLRLRNYMTRKITAAYTQRGYTQIEAPIIENIENLENSEGGENLRMLFKVLKRGEKLDLERAKTENDLCDLGLRFDLTLPLSRFYANNLNSLVKPFKAFQMGNVFRAERNQKGRLRQFVQCDVDTLGDPTIYAEIDLMLTVPKALYDIGFEEFTIKVNDRRILRDIVIGAGFSEEEFAGICIIADKADKIGEEGVIAELLDKGYERDKIDSFLKNLNASLEDMDTDYANDLKLLIKTVSERYPIEFDPTLVRGMGYYTGPIFEIVAPGFSGSIAGGGRYDGLLTKFSKESIPAVGFSIGFERIFNILKDQGFVPPEEEKVYAVLFASEDLYKKALELADEKIAEGNIASIYKIRPNRIGKEVANFKKNGYEVIVVDEL
ncbi:histidine--tRNA ligase [Filifactor villosus]|uniref:Histidine--tRNA ligase n=1 Tax=Filifactor villosus TaxID=29374 RepID=A0ABV9QLX2_9FIRM